MNRMTELAAFLRAHDDFALFGHANPDGDTAGCCVALALALRKLGKRAFVYLPGGMPELYKVFPCTAEIADGRELPFAPQTGFSVDVSEPNRMGAGRELFEACAHRAALDHHATNPGFGEVCVVDGDAAACGELAVALIRELGVEMNAEMGQWLFIALSTDSGRFGYASTRPETLEAAAENGRDFSAVKAALEQAVTAFFNGHLLGKPVLMAELVSLAFRQEGVENVRLVSPAADIAAGVGVLPVLGTLTVTELGA